MVQPAAKNGNHKTGPAQGGAVTGRDAGGSGNSTEVAKTGGAPVPSARAARLAADAGKGVSKDRDDKFVPIIRVRQSQSPECLRQRPEYIAGAEAGDFFLKTTLKPVIKGGDGL